MAACFLFLKPPLERWVGGVLTLRCPKRLADVLPHRPHLGGIDAVNIGLLLPHLLHRRFNFLIASGKLLHQRHPLARKLLLFVFQRVAVAFIS